MAQAYSYFLIEYEKVDIFLIQNKDNINHKSFFQKWLIWNIVVEWAYYCCCHLIKTDFACLEHKEDLV